MYIYIYIYIYTYSGQDVTDRPTGRASLSRNRCWSAHDDARDADVKCGIWCVTDKYDRHVMHDTVYDACCVTSVCDVWYVTCAASSSSAERLVRTRSRHARRQCGPLTRIQVFVCSCPYYISFVFLQVLFLFQGKECIFRSPLSRSPKASPSPLFRGRR